MVQQEPGLLEALPAEEPGICGAESPEAAGAQPAEAHDCKDGRDDRGYCVRTLRNDFTIAHNRKLYQIEESVKTKEVTVEERVNGSMFVIQNGIRLPFREITARPEKPKAPVHARRYKSRPQPADHPWKKWNSRLIRQMRGQTKKPKGVATS